MKECKDNIIGYGAEIICTSHEQTSHKTVIQKSSRLVSAMVAPRKCQGYAS